MPSFYFLSKAQSSLEFVLILAVIFSLGLIVLALSGFFPSFSFSSQIGDSGAYWAQSASPLRVLDAVQQSSNARIIVQNSAGTTLTVSRTTLTLPNQTSYSNASAYNLSPGGTYEVDVAVPGCASGARTGFDVLFNYSTEQISGLYQSGLKPLYVLCK